MIAVFEGDSQDYQPTEIIDPSRNFQIDWNKNFGWSRSWFSW